MKILAITTIVLVIAVVVLFVLVVKGMENRIEKPTLTKSIEKLEEQNKQTAEAISLLTEGFSNNTQLIKNVDDMVLLLYTMINQDDRKKL